MKGVQVGHLHGIWTGRVESVRLKIFDCGVWKYSEHPDLSSVVCHEAKLERNDYNKWAGVWAGVDRWTSVDRWAGVGGVLSIKLFIANSMSLSHEHDSIKRIYRRVMETLNQWYENDKMFDSPQCEFSHFSFEGGDPERCWWHIKMSGYLGDTK